MHDKAATVKVFDNFRADKSRRPGDQTNRSRHVQVPLSAVWFLRRHNLIGYQLDFQMETC
jgi:hypothetical protein